MQTTSRRQIHFVRDGEGLAASAAEAFVASVEEGIAARGVAAVALCGGSTTRRLFGMLSEEPYASRLERLWTRIHVFWTTERNVSPDHPDSCFRLAHWALLGRFAIPSRNIHRIKTEMADSSGVAAAYQEELRAFFLQRGLMRDGLPCFDLTILALEDREEAEMVEARSGETGRWVTTRTAPTRERGEIVMTLPVLGNARNSLVLFPDGDAAAAGRAAHLLRFVA